MSFNRRNCTTVLNNDECSEKLTVNKRKIPQSILFSIMRFIAALSILELSDTTNQRSTYSQDGTVEINSTLFEACYALGFLSTEITGGAIYAYNSDVKINGIRMFNNQATYAGGIALERCTANIQSTFFEKNVATRNVGALWIQKCSSVTLSQINLTGNQAQNHYSGMLFVNSEVYVSEGTFRSNSASNDFIALAVLQTGIETKSVLIKASLFEGVDSTMPIIHLKNEVSPSNFQIGCCIFTGCQSISVWGPYSITLVYDIVEDNPGALQNLSVTTLFNYKLVQTENAYCSINTPIPTATMTCALSRRPNLLIKIIHDVFF